jgi:hypothetical protein
MDIDSLKLYIENIYGENISYSDYTNIYDSSDFAEDLQSAGIIKNTKTKSVRIQFSHKNKNLATCNYMLLLNENIGYISDIEIHSDIQNNEIGTKIRKYAINELNKDANIIYSYPTNEHIKYICKKQGFEPIDEGPLSGWYIRD